MKFSEERLKIKGKYNGDSSGNEHITVHGRNLVAMLHIQST
jgi:hypothetical protein